MLSRIQRGILDSEIPRGGRGRPLTLAERRKLARAGIKCTARHIVVRLAMHTPMRGRVYEPDDSAEAHHPLELVVS